MPDIPLTPRSLPGGYVPPHIRAGRALRARESSAWTNYRDNTGKFMGDSNTADDLDPITEKTGKAFRVKEETAEETKPASSIGQGLVKKNLQQASPIPFVLPRVQLEVKYVEDDLTLQYAQQLSFSEITLAWAFQQAISFEAIKDYIYSYPLGLIRKSLSLIVDDKSEVSLHPKFASVLFYAVERNCPRSVRLLLELGADPNTVIYPYDMPILAFAILHAENECLNTTSIVTTLLGLGASSFCIPKDMWEDYLKVPRTEIPTSNQVDVDTRSSWCTPTFRAALSRTLNLTQRYFLAKAATLKPPSGRMKQIAKAHNITALLEAPYHLVGQAPATTVVLSRVFGHIALCADTPLILIYAGPSGHGKTELAKQMGTLMSVDLLVVDCTEMRYETDIFGPKNPFFGSAEGSPLNNYLAQHSGERSIVFLDEFEKTTDNVRLALLLAFDSGTYRDRRNGEALDCSKTIWVLATNHGTETIVKFYNQYMKDQTEEVRAAAPLSLLDIMLKKAFTQEMGAPLTGRVTLIVPFVPFSPGEQAVVTHKFILDFVDKMRQPIDLIAKRFVGHIHLHIQNDTQIASHLAEIGYQLDLGARSLQRMVQQHIHVKLADKYVEGDDEVTEGINEGPLQKYGVLLKVIEDEMEVVVNKEGFTPVRK